jgi:hypothetical protein
LPDLMLSKRKTYNILYYSWQTEVMCLFKIKACDRDVHYYI